MLVLFLFLLALLSAGGPLTAPEAAKYLKISERQLWRLVKRRLVAHYRPHGRSVRFLRKDLDVFLAGGRVEPEPHNEISA